MGASSGRWQKQLRGERLEPRLVLDSTVAINEIMYNPAGPTDAEQEWVELYNQLAVDIDLSGWSLAGGVEFEFPTGTVIPRDSYLVVAADPAALAAATGYNDALGPLAGRLSNGGEEVELLNNSGRVMDRIDYGDRQPWPVGPDGSGAALAKADPQFATAPPGNWTVSAEVGGTPGRDNFPRFDPTPRTTTLVPRASEWSLDDSGRDLGAAWREPDLDDTAWPIATAVLSAGTAPVGTVAPIDTLFSTGLSEDGTPLAAGQPDPHWTRTATGEPLTAMAAHPAWLENDADSAWVGLVAQGATNVDAGQFSFHTQFDLSRFDVSTASIQLRVAVDNQLDDVLLNGRRTGITAAGFGGLSRPFAIEDGFLPGVNTLDFALTNAGTSPNPSGLRVQLDGEAVSTADNPTLSLGPATYYFRHSFDFAGAPRADWRLQLDATVDDGAVFYLNGNELYRHNMPAGPINFETPALQDIGRAEPTGPISLGADHLRIGRNVLAVEVHQSAGDRQDVVFDAELTVTETPRAPEDAPRLAFNEIPPAGEPGFWVELVNVGPSTVDLEGYIIADTAGQGQEVVLPAGSLAPGQLLQFSQPQLGLQPAVGDHLFLYGPNKTSVIDGQVVTDQLRGRSPRQDGRWLYPAAATPGEPNRFDFHDEIVINEIMYHGRGAPSVQGVPPTYDTTTLVAMDSTWRYSRDFNFGPGDLPPDLGPDWAQQSHEVDQFNWLEGQAPIGFSNRRLPVRINQRLTDPTLVTNYITTYYFETDFGVSQPQLDQMDELLLQQMVDDGAVFYLNGQRVDQLNMPEGPVTAATLASTEVGRAVVSEPKILPKERLVVLPAMNRLSVEVHQGSIGSEDIVLAAELTGRTLLDPGSPPIPPVDSTEEWIELTNRGQHAVDLTGWRLDDAVRFQFPAGTLLDPGQYLVVAGDADGLRAKYPRLTNLVGNFSGRLANGGERILLLDPSENPADEVTYYDGGNWPAYADGSGSSLELRDPDADNSRAEAWTASDESGKSQWHTYTYRGIAQDFPGTNDPDVWNEFIFGMLDAGEILIDDVSVIEDPDGAAIQLIQNGAFDAGTDHYRMLGNHGSHGRSQVVADQDDPANQVLHLVASGATEHMSNHVETTLADGRNVSDGTQYQLSFRAKWLAGSNQLNSRLYFNQLGHKTLLEVPELQGTPGERNSQLQTNIGPTFAELRQQPIVPQADEDVTVSVAAADPDGVAAATLWYRVNDGAWSSLPMSGEATGGVYRATIPGQRRAAVIQFYVEAADGLGAASTFPAGGPDSRALIKVDDGRGGDGPQPNLRIIMTRGDVRLQVRDTEVMSNDRRGATVVFADREVYYDVGVRLKGSGFSRAGGARGFNIRFNPDHLFRGVHDVIAVDRNGGPYGLGASHRELVLKHIMNNAGGVPTMYDELIHFIPPDSTFTGSAQLLMARYDDEFLASTFENGADGTRFKFELVYYSTLTRDRTEEGLKLPPASSPASVFPVLGVELRDMGDDREAYRWNFLIKNHRQADDYSRIIELGKTLSLTGSDNGGELDRRSQQVMDVDQWLRTFAFESLVGINDTYNQGLPHNLQLFVRPEDGRVVPLPWDMDFAFHQPTSMPLLGTGSNLRKVLNIPNNRHYFYGHLQDIISTTYNLDYLTPWIERYAEVAQQDLSRDISNYIRARRSFVLGRLPAEVDFAVATPSPLDAGPASTVTLTGAGWVNVREIRLAGSDQPLDVVWTDDDRWQATVPVAPGTHEIELQAYDFQGQPIGVDRITITSTAFVPEPGDSNLDGQFDQRDIVLVLQGNRYLTGQPASFEEGDWDQSGQFDQLDIVAALRTGNYLQGPYAAAGGENQHDLWGQLADEALDAVQPWIVR